MGNGEWGTEDVAWDCYPTMNDEFRRATRWRGFGGGNSFPFEALPS